MQSTIERAFELARSGDYKTIDELDRQLRKESYEQVSEHLHGYGLRKQLSETMKIKSNNAGTQFN